MLCAVWVLAEACVPARDEWIVFGLFKGSELQTLQQSNNTMSQGNCALYLGAIFSTLFRLSVYLFLRVVCFSSLCPACPFVSHHRRLQAPSRWCKHWLPGLYFAYVATVPIAPRLSRQQSSTPPPSSPPSSSDAKEGESTLPAAQNEVSPYSPSPSP